MITKRENSESRAELVRAMPSRERGRVILKDSIETAYQQYLRGYNYTGITPVIIDFYATWCGPCQALAPMLKRLADEYNGRIKVLKVDVDKNQALAAAARIQSIPTLFFITKEGDIERVVGGLPYQELVRMAEKISSSEE